MSEDSKAGDVDRDLFGEPLQPWRDPRGRKRHRRVAQAAEKVAVLRASGLTVEEIASMVGLSEPTLRKYYFRELDEGATMAKAVIFEAMFNKAKAGSAAAARYLREEFEKGAAAVPVSRRREKPPAEEKLGKKATADLEAQTAHEGTPWGDLLKH